MKGSVRFSARRMDGSSKRLGW